MPEDIHGDRSDIEGLADLPFGELTPLEANVNVYDEAYEKFLDACSEFTVDPTDLNKQSLIESMRESVNKFSDVVRATMQTEPDADNRSSMLATIIVTSSEKRQELFDKLAPPILTFEVDDKGNTESEYDDAEHGDMFAYLKFVGTEGDIPTTEEFVEYAADAYRQALFGDTQYFAEKVVRNYRQRPNIEIDTKSKLHKAGEHALRVAEIAAGVAIALWLTDKRRSR